MIRLCTITLFCSAFILGMAGCFSSSAPDIQKFKMPDEVNTTSENYILQPPDVVQVICSKIPELNGQEQRIRPDGRISLESIGELEAAGKTPSQLAADLRAKVLELYKSELISENSIDLRVVGFQSAKYYVLGQVYSPGPKLYTGRDSVLSAVSQAQPNPMAWIERIQVIRPSVNKDLVPPWKHDGIWHWFWGMFVPKQYKGANTYAFEVNFDRMMAHGDITKNVLLQEGDVIYVPPTILGWAALKIEEVIRPIARAFSAVYIVENQGAGAGYGY
jgi:polysaccharide biosynthesis/export protein